MASVQDLKDIYDFIKKSANLDMVEKFVQMREEMLQLREQYLALKIRNTELEEAFKIKGDIQFDGSAYWLADKGKRGPYCQKCWDTEQKLVRLQDYGDGWYCLACEKSMDKKKHTENR